MRRAALALALGAAVCGCSLVLDVGSLRGGDAGPLDAATDAAGEASPCGDVQTSAQHCGRCGHDCLGGACVAGACQPVNLASQQAGVNNVVVDAERVYFTVTGGFIRSIPVGGGTVAAVGAGSVSGLDKLRLDGTTLRAIAPVNGGGFAVFAVAKTEPPTGAAAAQTATLKGTTVFDFTLDDQRLYVTQDAVSPCISAALPCLRALGKEMNAAVTDLEPVTAGAQVRSDGQLVLVSGTSLRVWAQPGPSKELAALPGPGTALAIDARAAYVAIPSLGTVSEVLRTGGAPKTLASAQATPRLLVTSGDLFWVTDQGIHGCDPTRCAETTVSYDKATPSSLAADARALYWADPQRAGIYKLAR